MSNTKTGFQILDQDFEPIHSLKTNEKLNEKIDALRTEKVACFYVVDHKNKKATVWTRKQKNYHEEPADYDFVTAEKPLPTSEGKTEEVAKAEAAAIDASATDANDNPVSDSKGKK